MNCANCTYFIPIIKKEFHINGMCVAFPPQIHPAPSMGSDLSTYPLVADTYPACGFFLSAIQPGAAPAPAAPVKTSKTKTRVFAKPE